MGARKWRLQIALSCIVFISSYGVVANANKNSFEALIKKRLEVAQRDKGDSFLLNRNQQCFS
ncbi:hypothetical protein IGI67_005129 [Enterococcus sp. AZ196]